MSEKCSDDAVSEVIAFMLVFVIIVVTLAGWVLFYVPAEGHKVEIQHDDDVLKQFSDIKQGIDLLWTTDSKGRTIERLVSLSPTKGTDLSTRMFLSPLLGSGTIKIEEGTNFTIYEEMSDKNYNKYNVSLMRISYTSFNEYSNDFTVVYDGGAVFYGNTHGDQYLLGSPIYGGNKLYLVNISSPKEEIILGNFPVTVKLSYMSKSNPINPYSFTNINSDYQDYWENYALNKSINHIDSVTILNYYVNIIPGTVTSL